MPALFLIIIANAIWILNTQLFKYINFGAFHKCGILVADMIISQQMKRSVDDKMGQMVVKSLSLRIGFGRACFP